MATCKECAHKDVCPVPHLKDATICPHFKDCTKYVEVVHCKDCKHGIYDEENEMWRCVESAEYDEKIGEWFGFYAYNQGEHFCSYGERREGE